MKIDTSTGTRIFMRSLWPSINQELGNALDLGVLLGNKLRSLVDDDEKDANWQNLTLQIPEEELEERRWIWRECLSQVIWMLFMYYHAILRINKLTTRVLTLFDPPYAITTVPIPHGYTPR